MKKQRIELACENCGATFHKLPCQLGRGRGKYCSRQCKYEGTKTKIDVSCANCGNTVKKFICEMDNDTHFCSKECYHAFREINAKPNTYLKDNSTHVHRVVAEQYLGRPLLESEIVHHIDEDKHNNEPYNLAVLPDQGLHAKIHFSKRTIDIEPYKLLNLSHDRN